MQELTDQAFNHHIELKTFVQAIALIALTAKYWVTYLPKKQKAKKNYSWIKFFNFFILLPLSPK